MAQKESQLNIICLETQAFYSLVEEVAERVRQEPVHLKKWLSDEEVMELLNIKSKTTLQKLRDEGHIRYTHPVKRIILYDRQSIMDYLEKHSKETFK